MGSSTTANNVATDIQQHSSNSTKQQTAFVNDGVVDEFESTLRMLSTNELRYTGNKLCSHHKYDEAITYYSIAISKNPSEPIFYSNRALCYYKLASWQLAAQDCRQALELDSSLLKAHFFLGQALAELEQFDEAIKHLQKAHELAREKKLNYGDDIASQIRLTKRRRWNKIERSNVKLEQEMKAYLLELLRKDKDAKLAACVAEKQQRRQQEPQAGSSSSTSASQPPQPTASTTQTKYHNNDADDDEVKGNHNNHHHHHHHDDNNDDDDDDDDDDDNVLSCQKRATTSGAYESEIKARYDTYFEKLNSMFEAFELQRQKRDVPDYLCGKISFEIMQDPVITPSGITYDRPDIEEHLKRVGHFDPVTRQPLRQDQMIPNLVMKEVVDAFLGENEWALYY